MSAIEFKAFPKIGRLRRGCIITEKIDGTNACVVITEEGEIGAQSRNRVITPESDNMGFAKWVQANREDLMILGPGYHYGEWWGNGIQRTYHLKGLAKRFSLFNVSRWRNGSQPRPACCEVVPTIYEGEFSNEALEDCLTFLRIKGSLAAPGFMRPEGVVVYLKGNNSLAKVLLENDEISKTEAIERGIAA